MRSRFFGLMVVFSVLAFFAGGQAFAMPSDADLNTAQMTKLAPASWSPEGWGFPLTLGFGATGDYVIDRTLDDNSDISEGHWGSGNLYWDPLENVHLELFAGVAEMRIGSVGINNTDAANSGTKVELESEAGLAVGGGGKVDILEFPFFPHYWPDLPKMKLFGAGGYRHAGQMDVDEIHAGFDADRQDLQIEVNEWQATVGVSQQWNNPIGRLGWGDWLNFNVITYVGAQYSDLQVNISGNSAIPVNDLGGDKNVKTGTRNSDVPVAVVAGLQILSFSDTFSVNLEGRFIAETAGSVSGHLRW